MLSKRSSDIIRALRFPLIVMIVFAHVPSGTTQHLSHVSIIYDIYLFISNTISFTLGHIRIQLFFVLSSYFFFYSITEKQQYQQVFIKQKKRLRTIVLPYLIWNLLTFGVYFLKHKAFDLLGLSNENDQLCTSLTEILWTGPINYPLWFMRDLICMFALTPIFLYLLNKYGWRIIVLLLLIYLVGVNTGVPGLSITALLYFSIGGFMGLRQFDFIKWCSMKAKLFVPIAIVLSIIATMLMDDTYYYPFIRFYIPIGIIAFIGIISHLNEKQIKWLGSMSGTVFFIYATHEIYIINWVKGLFAKFIGYEPLPLLISYFVQPVIVLLICISFYKICKKIIPNCLAFMTGGRI